MKRTALPLALALSGAVLLTACQTTGTERGADASSAPTESPATAAESAEAVPSSPASEAPAVTVVDTSAGGAKDRDPLWSGMSEAFESDGTLYLDVWLHSASHSGGDATVTLTPDTSDSVTVTVPAAQVDTGNAPFYRVTGTFSVEEVATSAYVLTTVDESLDETLVPDGPTTEEACTSGTAGQDLPGAADTLWEDPGARDELRDQWASAPEVWWGIQRSAQTLADSEGDYAGDFLTEACGDYM
ncbi:hypothetical protein [Brevibacterium litoralis]|uniref:hypothetical protein n=1 Tax=Brevibacterium litoralis TaxID=3138935 RepID=UPI0032EB6CA0